MARFILYRSIILVNSSILPDNLGQIIFIIETSFKEKGSVAALPFLLVN